MWFMHKFIKIRAFRTIAVSVAFASIPYPAFAEMSATGVVPVLPAQPKLAVVLNSGEATVSLIDMPSRRVIKTTYIGRCVMLDGVIHPVAAACTAWGE